MSATGIADAEAARSYEIEEDKFDRWNSKHNTSKEVTQIREKDANDDDELSIGGRNTNQNGSEELPKLKRELKSRHMQMLAMGGTIGTGLFIGSGTALQNGGPVGCLLGYLLVALIVFCVIISLAEMCTLFPVSGSFTHYAARFVDPALGFAQGWNYFYCWGIAIPLELVAAGIVITYWDTKTNIAVYITVFFALIVAINLLGTKMYGETEFWLSGLKVITILGLLILGIVLILGGGPTHDRIGFRYWKEYGVLNQYNDIPGSLGRFLAVWSTFVNGAFSYSGSELVAVTAGESKDPRRNIPKALKKVFVRLVVLYCGSVFVIGVLVPYNSPQLVSAATSASTAAASPFVIFIKNAEIKVLPDIINAVILTAVLSAANSDLYAASRTLYALSTQTSSMTPKIFKRVPKTGPFKNLPVWCVIATSLLGFLAYLNLSSGATVVFNWLVNLSTIAVLLTWCFICVSYLRFFYACKVQNLNRDELPFKGPFQPYLAWTGTIATSLIILFSGFYVFLEGNWSVSSFLTAYLGAPIYATMYFGYKFIMKTSIIPLAEIDIQTGRNDSDIQLAQREGEQSWLKRVYSAVL
ncbi:Predicted protein [Taphrina deformans PYCC 5710]|uniref:Amino acid permease/ SLC12A domain-containing protein n=1 Tax=Taphrina deformans (strain PYCC 5710 / ATCC 11124 / CBS 356.35 / IMI 108563 / JCM 9778 / NBRC 8474) TaxID=1097556 RepID=R4XB25_TAPDE|nr:Predicted protein [Taphrina deformans PYCC 5710]|eukprot:CCG82790.1 Predicted protein [Taphrina deformans PYCC 5710]